MTPQDLQSTIRKAQKMIAERLLLVPTYGVYIHARDQLNLIEIVLSNGLTPTEVQKGKIDIALMAVKELESSEPELADILCMVDYHFKKWV